MLNDLLTEVSAGRVCFAEPRLHSKKPYRENKRSTLEALGMSDVKLPAEVIGRIGDFERFGVKEVRSRNIRRAYKMFEVDQTVIIVRDARACLFSYFKKHQTSDAKHKPFPGKLFVRTSRTILRLLDELPADRVRIVRYEEFVRDEKERESLAEWLDWPLNGDVSSTMKARGRGSEVERHAGKISAATVNRGETPLTDEQRPALEPVLRKIEAFQKIGRASCRERV